jgi:thioester reductase-like protein
MKAPVFLTGATGFLGMEVLARLLEAGDREVVALIRASDDAAAEDRLHGVLAALYRDPSNHRDHVRAVSGDVTSPGLGLENGKRTALAEEIGAVMHCAASIAFDLPLDEARAINVEGTREVIGFARECKALGRLERFVHVSTAYVSGKYEGTFRERQLDTGQQFRNTYEQTKWEAEHVVREAGDLSPCIARPSIVMGESDTGWTPAFNVLYWPLRAFSRGLFDEIPSLPSAHVDIVPVDYVADALVRLLDTDAEGVFNLVSGRDAPFASELVELACDRFDRPRPKVVQGGGGADDEAGAVYLPYFDMELVFDDSRARAVLEPAGISPPRLADYFGRLMDYAETVKWGKRSMTREEAHERLAEERAAA